ncbi:hypothetical protein Tco_0128969 [Tanacetum coccineum]
MKKVDRGITMINHTQAEAMGILTNVLFGRGFLRTIGGIVNIPKRLFSTFDGFCHQTFHAARSDVMRNAESDSDDEEEYEIKRNKLGAPIYGLKPAPYLNCNDPGWNRDAKSRYNTRLAQLIPRHIYSPYVVNWDVMNRMGCDGEFDDMLRIKLRVVESNEEIFTFVAWIRAFNINEPIYAELCHEFYLIYEFDKVCANDELQSKKIIKFKLGGRAHNLTLLEFARRLGLYHVDELEEDGFDVYFQGGLRSDDNFNAQEYWLSISREENLGLSRSHTSIIRSPVLRVIHKMITYGLCQRTIGYEKIQKNDLWLLSMFDARHQNGYANVAWVIARWMKKKGVGTQKESQIFCGQFILKIARKCRVLTDDVVRSLSALIYCRDLDTITLRDLIDSEGKLILEDPQPSVPRVGIPRPPRASMHDFYDKMDRMEIRQKVIERMEYMQSYH